MDNKGKIGQNGLDTSGDSRSRNASASPAVGFCIDRAKVVSRPKSPKSAHLGKRHSKAIVALLVFAAAIVIVSGIALAPVGKEKALHPAETQGPPPGTPYNVFGYTYDAVGAKLPDCSVTITDLTTGDSKVTVSDPTFAAYMVSLPSFAPTWDYGDDIKITATKDVRIGENQSIVAGSKLWLNATLDVQIPEFPMVIVPVTGMIVLMAVVSLRRRSEEQ
ncbi:MAG: hypothetical protein NTY62_07310 [Euryarchaeota archaeon]|nr:hypothetical protein [Euryarchaeota archaeon]